MDEEQINALMKYVRGEMSFAEWIESGGVTGDREQNDDDNEVEVQDGENEVDQEWDVAEQETQDDANEEQRGSGGRLSCKLSMEFLNLSDHVYCRYCRRNVDRVSAEYRSIFR